jgi:hypothetical protein
MMGAIVNTFSIAILASLIATIVGTLAVLGMAAMKPKTQNVLLGFNNIPMLNADIVTGIALMLFFLMVGAPRGYMTILFSHATFCIPYVILSVRPRVNKNTDRLYEAALDLGASERYAFRKIVLAQQTQNRLRMPQNPKLVGDGTLALSQKSCHLLLTHTMQIHQSGYSLRLFNKIQILPLQILDHCRHGRLSVVHIHHNAGHVRQPCQLCCPQTALSGNQLISVIHPPHRKRLQNTVLANGCRQF